MQRLAEFVQRQRLHMILKIRCALRRIGARERAELRRRHRHWSAAVERVFETDLKFAQPAIGHGVQCLHTLHFECHAQLQMVLQIFTHAGRIDNHRDLVLRQQTGRTNA